MAARNMTDDFGLLTIAAKAEVATETKVTFSNLCTGQPGHDSHAASAVKMPKSCDTCGPITDLTVLAKGVKSGSTYTLVDKDAVVEAKESYGANYKGVLNVVPHPAAEFLNSTAQGDSLHYITPAEASSADHYQLMVRLVTEHPELAFVGLYTPVSATALYHLTVREGILVLAKRTREQAMKPLPDAGGKVNDALYAMLDGALPSFVTDYDPANYEDTYSQTLEAMIAAGETLSVGGAAKPDLRALVSDDDLMAKLAALTAPAKPAKKAPTKRTKKATAA